MQTILPQPGQPAPAAGTQRGAHAAAAPAQASAAVVAAQLLQAEPVKFDPVPVFVGPKPGWTGPVLAARPATTSPSDATAYTTAAPAPAADAETAPAPMALQGAVKSPATLAKKKLVKAPINHRHEQAKAAAKAKATED